MDPHLFGYMNYAPMVDPLRYMEMQAQYLRLLAQFLADPEPSDRTTERQIDTQQDSRRQEREQVSRFVQVELSEPVAAVTSEEVFVTEPRSNVRVSSEMPLPPILEVSPPITRVPTEEAVPAPRRRAKNFDDIPISAANRGFEALLEEELRKDKAPVEIQEPKQHNFLKKGQRNPLRSSKQTTPAPAKPAEEAKSKQAAPREFLKRRSGQLCTKKGQVTVSPGKKGKRADYFQEEVPEWTAQNLAQDEPLGPPGADVLEKLRKQVQLLSADITRLREENTSDAEEALNIAIETAKNERVTSTQEQVRSELEARKRLESAEWSREKRSQDKSTVRELASEAEALKTRIRELQEEARTKEDAHRAAADSLRQQIENLRKKAGGKVKQSQFTAKATEAVQKPKVDPPKIERIEVDKVEQATSPKSNPQPRAEARKTVTTRLEVAKAEVPHSAHAEQPKAAQKQSAPEKPAPELEATPTFEVKVQSQTTAPDGKIQRIYSDGRKEVVFPNGVRKEVLPDNTSVVYFANKDIKTTHADGRVVYHFAEAQTTQTTYPDKLQVFQFSNGQIEKHFPDGMKEIKFTDGTVKCIFPDGEEESIFPDGTVQKIDSQGVKYIDNVNGQKDTVYPDGSKVREYPDGTVKRFDADGKVAAA